MLSITEKHTVAGPKLFDVLTVQEMTSCIDETTHLVH